MTQRAFKTPPQPVIPEPPSHVRSLHQDPRKTTGRQVSHAILHLSIEHRGIVGDGKRNAAELLNEWTYDPLDPEQKRRVWAGPLTMEQWAEALETSEHNANDDLRELEEAGVIEVIDGQEARKLGLSWPRGTHSGTKYYRLRIENWGNVKVSQRKPPTPIDQDKAKAPKGEPFRLRMGEPVVVAFDMPAKQVELRFDSDNQELLFDPVKIVQETPVFCISVANKTTSESQIPPEQDVLTAEKLGIRDGLIEFLAGHKKVLTPEFGQKVLDFMGWPALDFLEPLILDSMRRARIPWGVGFLNSERSLGGDVRRAWPAEKARREKVSAPAKQPPHPQESEIDRYFREKGLA